MWAYPILRQEGYLYSSSINPIQHDLYGIPDAPRVPFHPDPYGVIEIPMTTVRLMGRNWPCSGGGYFRLLPKVLYRAGLARVNRHDRQPGIFYFHPWEIDAGPAAYLQCRAEVADPALHQSVTHGRRTGQAVAGFPVGPDGSRLCAGPGQSPKPNRSEPHVGCCAPIG